MGVMIPAESVTHQQIPLNHPGTSSMTASAIIFFDSPESPPRWRTRTSTLEFCSQDPGNRKIRCGHFADASDLNFAVLPRASTTSAEPSPSSILPLAQPSIRRSASGGHVMKPKVSRARSWHNSKWRSEAWWPSGDTAWSAATTATQARCCR